MSNINIDRNRDRDNMLASGGPPTRDGSPTAPKDGDFQRLSTVFNK
jgi:hypothetical protein